MKTHTLKRQFRIWTLLLVIVPSLLVMIIYSIGQIKAAKDNNVELMIQRVQSQEQLITYWMRERVAVIHELSQIESIRVLDEQKMKNVLNFVQQHNQSFDSLSYINKDGIFKMSTLNKPIQYHSAVSQPYFQAAIMGKEYISDAVIGRNSGLPIINFSAPIFDYNVNFQGLILGSVKMATLELLLRDNWIGKTGEVILVNRDGVMLTEPRNIKGLIDRGIVENTAIMKLKITEDALRNIKLGESGTATWNSYSEEKMIGAYKGMPEHGWTLIGKIKETEILTPIYNQLATMAGSTLFFIVLILPLATLITNRIQRPLDWLIRQSNLMATEDYKIVDQERYLKNIPNELAILCENFVNMNHKITSTVDLLRQNETRLERKVLEIEDINSTLAKEVCERQTAEKELQKLNTDLENKVYERTIALLHMNKILEEEISKYQSAIKELKSSRNALVSSEKRYKDLFDYMHNGCAYHKVVFDEDENPIDLEYLEVNHAYEKSVGTLASELIGKRRTEVFPDINEDIFTWVKWLITVAISEEPVSFTEIFKHQERSYLISAYSPAKDHVAVISEDITKYVTLQKEVARMDKLNLIGNMAAGLAHEVRNPMTVVKGYLQHFKKKFPDSLQDQLDVVLGELARIEMIITDFLAIAKTTPTEPKEQDLNEIINSIAPLILTDALKRGMNLEFKLSREIPKLILSDKEIKQLLLNLAMNGLNAMQEHGILKIETIYQDGAVILYIDDSGSGIAKELQKKIFDPFFTTRDQGTGLGLSVCASIVASHNGTIEVHSEEGNGTRFIITFPVIKELAS